MSKTDPKEAGRQPKPHEGSNYVDWSIGKRCFYLNKVWWVVVQTRCPTCKGTAIVMRRKDDWVKEHRP